MNPAEMAREMMPADNATGSCLLVVDIEKLRCVCHAVLDAEAYKKRVEGVAASIKVYTVPPVGSPPKRVLRRWFAQLTEKVNG